jgi:hypothetical protein
LCRFNFSVLTLQKLQDQPQEPQGGTSAPQGGMSATQPLTTERNSVVTARPTTSGASALQKPASLTTQSAENAQRTVAIRKESTTRVKTFQDEWIRSDRAGAEVLWLGVVFPFVSVGGDPT